MPRRSARPLERKGREIIFYEGDWDELRNLLAPKKLTPSVFIREMVSRKIRSIQDRAQVGFQDVDVEIEI